MTWTSERTIDADGVPIFLREAGDGPPILLLHGFPQTGRCWDRVASTLAKEHRVLVPDLPGYGGSGRPGSLDVPTVARTIEAAARAAGVERATVVGHDWGGAVAYRLAGSHRDLTERLVIVNSPYRELDMKRGWYMLAFNLPVLPELALTATRGRLIDAFLKIGAKDPSAFGDALPAYRDAFRTWERRRNAFGYYRAMSREALVRALPFIPRPPSDKPGRITCPTMIVWGEEDPALPVRLVDGIARSISHARVERLPGIGHFVPEEAPDALSDLIADFTSA